MCADGNGRDVVPEVCHAALLCLGETPPMLVSGKDESQDWWRAARRRLGRKLRRWPSHDLFGNM